MAKKREINKFKFSFTTEQLDKVLVKMRDLATIDDNLVFKFNKENLLIYSLATGEHDNNNKNINAFKNFIFKTEDIITPKDDLGEQTITYIMNDTKKIAKNIKHFLDYEEDINCEITYDKINNYNFGDYFKFKTKKLKMNFQGGRPTDTNIDINKNLIEQVSDENNLSFEFNIPKGDFEKSKKLSYIEKENDVMYFIVKDGKINLGEHRWSMEVGESDSEDDNIAFPKKYFKSATCEGEEIKVSIYKTHLVFDNFNSSLLISREVTI